MDDFKLKNFKKEHGFDMPIIKHLSLDECNIVLENIFKTLGVKSIDKLYKKIESTFIHLNGFDANEKIDFINIFNKIQIPIPNNICVNLSKYNDLDIIAFDVFNKYYDDIWYPSADDIEIFDFSYQWILVIRHWGGIYYFKCN